MTSTDPELTLPSIVASLVGKYGAHEVVLTIAFHPDTSRIGHRAVVPKQTGNAPWVLGRYSPAFHSTVAHNRGNRCSDAQDAVDQSADVDRPDAHRPTPLNDPHISRRALHFELRGKHLTISRFADSSRCRVGNVELYDTVELEWDQLRAGVPLFLGHSIVLLLRLGPANVPAVSMFAGDPLLRGSSSRMAAIRDEIARAAHSDLDVLLRGETGTGKELVATAIHRASRRAEAPMVSVNMAAVPTELAAAALFGSARGAFTGADKATAGYFGHAEGGTLFLDEIGDTAPEVQPQLLRALQQREIQAVGGGIRRVDVRILSATDAELDGDDCEFKAALRHRLGACEILLPPLREHPEDIGELLLYFLQVSAAETGRTQLLPHAQTPAPAIAGWAVLFHDFLNYRWPGNVRELANFAQQVVLASDQFPIMNDGLRATLAPAGNRATAASAHPLRRKLQDISEDVFDAAMLANQCEIQRVARQLGVSRAAVYRRIEESPRYRLASEVTAHEVEALLTEYRGDIAAVAQYLRVSISSLRSHLRRLEMTAN